MLTAASIFVEYRGLAYSLADISSSYKISRKNDKAVKIMINTQILL